jgi:hypothetical protein
VRVEEQEEAVVDDAAPEVVRRRDRVAVQEHTDRARKVRAPVGVGHGLAVGAEPLDVRRPAERVALEPAAAVEDRMRLPERDELARELEQRGALLLEAPVEPAELVVLAVGVVVAALRAAHLVAHEQHRHALREKQRREQVALLPLAELQDLRIVGLAFGAAVPRAVVALAVAVLFAVHLVVLLVVRDEIAEREAVVRGHEVHARDRPPRVGAVEIGAAGEAVREVPERGVGAAPVVAHGVAEAPVPLAPYRRKVPDLIAALAEIPRLGDELHLAHDRILLDQIEERGESIDLVQLARERRREIEPEAVDVHLGDPVAKAVHQQLEHLRVPHVEAVAGARGVEVVHRIVGHEAVVGEVVDAAEAERRPFVVALGGVVVDDVEDHLDARRVQRPHHVLELLHLPAATALARVLVVRREEADRVVAPVVPQAAREQMPVVHEFVHRHELDRGHAEAQQVIDRLRMREPGVRAAQIRRDARVARGEAFDVELVDHRLVERALDAGLARPVEEGIDHDAARDVRRAVVGVLLHRRVEAMPEDRRHVRDAAVDRLGVGIEEEVVRVEAEALRRIPRTGHAEGVTLARAHLGQVPVEAMCVDLGQLDPRLLAAVVEEAEPHLVGVLAEDGEVRARSVVRRAEGEGSSRPDSVAHSITATPSGPIAMSSPCSLAFDPSTSRPRRCMGSRPRFTPIKKRPRWMRRVRFVASRSTRVRPSGATPSSAGNRLRSAMSAR